MKTLFLLFLLVFSGSILPGQSAFIDSLMRDIAPLDQKEKYEHLFKSADQLSRINYLESKLIADEAFRLATILGDEEAEFDCLKLIGDIALSLNDLDLADSVFNKALEIAEKKGKTGMINHAQTGMAKSLAMKGKWLDANKLHDEVIARSREAGDSLMWARGLMGKGINLSKVSAYESALQYYYEALAIYEALHDDYRKGIMHTNIGMVFLNLKRNAEALVEFEKARQICEDQNDTEGIMVAFLNLGVVHQKMGKFEQAVQEYQRAIVIAKELGSTYDVALLIANLGTTAMKQGRYDEALAHLKRAYEIKDSIGYTYDLPHTLNSLAEVSLYMKNYDAAMEYALKAEHLGRENGKLDQISVSYKLQSDIYEAEKNFPLAYQLLQKHKQLSDSVFSLQSDEAISNLNIQYETSRKEAQIAALEKKNEKDRRTKAILLITAFVIVVVGASLYYAMHTNRQRDKALLAKEKEVHELQNRFFANISHEFRTPLTLILGPLHTLRRQATSADASRMLKIVQKNAERLLFLINQILDLTKFDAKALELKKEQLDATTMIRGIFSSFDSLAEERNIAYHLEMHGHGFRLNADKRLLEIVLVNLISNAFKFTPDHGKISVSAYIDHHDKTMHIRVADSGVGIPEANLSKIFDRYYHDDRMAHSDFEGAGIGLALSKHIIELHGGSITVHSKLNEGTVFNVLIPNILDAVIDKIEEDDIEELFAEDDGLTTAGTFTESMNTRNNEKPILLLVEDRKDMREYVKSILQTSFQIIEASNANVGWMKALEHIPDIVISDVMMPGRSGLEFCSELKSDVRTSHIPVLLLTAKSAAEDRLSGLETQADVYLTKPFIPDELELHLRNIIASRKKLRAFYANHRRIEPEKMSFNSLDEQFLGTITKQMEAHYAEESFSVEQLAEQLNLSRSQLHRKLKALTGQSPNQLIRTFRLMRAYDMIKSNTATIAEIAFSVGFGSPAYFNKCFLEEFKMTPGDVKKKGVVT